MAKPIKPTTHDLVTISYVRQANAEQFADWCFPIPPTKDERKRFFDVIGWPEGYGYCCSNWHYAKQTGFLCVKNALNGFSAGA